MVMLGDLLAAARDHAGEFHRWLQACDPDFAEEIAAAAARDGQGPTAYVRAAVADFARHAGEEDWATLVSRLRKSDDPGATCLLAMVHWRMTLPVCGHHAGSGR